MLAQRLPAYSPSRPSSFRLFAVRCTRKSWSPNSLFREQGHSSKARTAPKGLAGCLPPQLLLKELVGQGFQGVDASLADLQLDRIWGWNCVCQASSGQWA